LSVFFGSRKEKFKQTRNTRKKLKKKKLKKKKKYQQKGKKKEQGRKTDKKTSVKLTAFLKTYNSYNNQKVN
jgi:hypothetical protein